MSAPQHSPPPKCTASNESGRASRTASVIRIRRISPSAIDTLDTEEYRQHRLLQALDLGIEYVGVCRSQQHVSWLVNLLNRASVESTVRQGTALYDQDMATCLQDHFKELIDELHAQGAAISDDEANDD